MLSLCVGAIPQLAPEGGAILRSAGVLPLRPVALIDPLGMNGKTPRGGRGGLLSRAAAHTAALSGSRVFERDEMREHRAEKI